MNASPGATGEPQPQWHRCEAFGLTIESDWPLPGSSLVPAGARSAAPVTRVIRVEPTVFDDAWAAEAERLLEYRPPDQPGSGVTFTADRSSAQYRFWAEDFGRYLVSVDGGMVACERGSVGREQNERFVFAHALPVAAILRGYEALHVSAVSGEAGAAAFAGASGTGKTRLASRLVARGAAFLTDDVLAVEAAGDDVLAHPGPAFMAIRPDDAAMIAEVGGRLGAAVGSSDKTHVSLPGRGAASPLRAIYHLHWGDAFQITPLQRGDLNRVLALSFVPYLTTPERLMRHLTIAQLVSAGVAQFRLQTPQSELGEEMLAALEAHMRDAGV